MHVCVGRMISVVTQGLGNNRNDKVTPCMIPIVLTPNNSISRTMMQLKGKWKRSTGKHYHYISGIISHMSFSSPLHSTVDMTHCLHPVTKAYPLYSIGHISHTILYIWCCKNIYTSDHSHHHLLILRLIKNTQHLIIAYEDSACRQGLHSSLCFSFMVEAGNMHMFHLVLHTRLPVVRMFPSQRRPFLFW